MVPVFDAHLGTLGMIPTLFLARPTHKNVPCHQKRFIHTSRVRPFYHDKSIQAREIIDATEVGRCPVLSVLQRLDRRTDLIRCNEIFWIG